MTKLLIHINYTWFTTGYKQSKECFHLSIIESSVVKNNFKVLAYFEIHLHKKDLKALQYIQEHLKGVGNIIMDNNSYILRISLIDELLDMIIPHFNKYSLVNEKLIDYLLWKTVIIHISKNKNKYLIKN